MGFVPVTDEIRRATFPSTKHPAPGNHANLQHKLLLFNVISEPIIVYWYINTYINIGRAMAQAFNCPSLTVEARVRSRVSPCSTCSGPSGTVTSFTQCSSVLSVIIITNWLSRVIYHLGDEQ
jgi:hypothetical protein